MVIRDDGAEDVVGRAAHDAAIVAEHDEVLLLTAAVT